MVIYNNITHHKSIVSRYKAINHYVNPRQKYRYVIEYSFYIIRNGSIEYCKWELNTRIVEPNRILYYDKSSYLDKIDNYKKHNIILSMLNI